MDPKSLKMNLLQVSIHTTIYSIRLKHFWTVRKLIIFILVYMVFYAKAQPVDIYKYKNNTSPTSLEDIRPLTFEDYIVQLAWQNSFDLEGSKYEIDARGQEISMAQKDWTKNLQAGLNVKMSVFLILTELTQHEDLLLRHIHFGILG